MTQPKQGDAQAAFQATCAASGINIAGLDALSQVQWALAQMLGGGGGGGAVFPGAVEVKGVLNADGNLVVGGTITVPRGVVTAGAADSGGTGFALLRVPN